MDKGKAGEKCVRLICLWFERNRSHIAQEELLLVSSFRLMPVSGDMIDAVRKSETSCSLRARIFRAVPPSLGNDGGPCEHHEV